MSDLIRFRDHAREMSVAEHKPECGSLRKASWVAPGQGNGPRRWMGLEEWIPPKCPGCVSESDRALWHRLASEVDAYLNHDEHEGLFA